MELIPRALDDYRQQLIMLLPPGRLWPSVEFDNTISALLEVIAVELLQIHTRVKSLIDEMVPDRANELLDRWESIVGLPDACTAQLTLTLQERVNAVLAKLAQLGRNRGTLSEAYYIEQAAILGYTITITVLSANNWQINAPATTTTFFKAGASKTGDKIQSSSNDLLQCVMNRIKPAHTALTYNFT